MLEPEETEEVTPKKKFNVNDPNTRFWIYGIAVAAFAVAVGYGLVTEEQAVLWTALAGAVLSTLAGRNVQR